MTRDWDNPRPRIPEPGEHLPGTNPEPCKPVMGKTVRVRCWGCDGRFGGQDKNKCRVCKGKGSMLVTPVEGL